MKILSFHCGQFEFVGALLFRLLNGLLVCSNVGCDGQNQRKSECGHPPRRNGLATCHTIIVTPQPHLRFQSLRPDDGLDENVSRCCDNPGQNGTHGCCTFHPWGSASWWPLPLTVSGAVSDGSS